MVKHTEGDEKHTFCYWEKGREREKEEEDEERKGKEEGQEEGEEGEGGRKEERI